MGIREDIVRTAREYLDTPFKHQGRLKGIGIDCAGLVICVGKELGIVNHHFEHQAYGHLPHSGMMQAHCDEQMNRILIEDAKIGDVFLMAFQKEPQHLCIITDVGIIHSYAQARRCVEHSIDEIWKARVKRAYRFTGVNDG